MDLFGLIELIVMYIAIAMVTRYVFLENGLERKIQTWYHAIVVILLIFSYALFGKTAATVLLCLAGMINIMAGRKEHFWRGALLIVPIIGIVDGLLLPIIILPAKLFAAETKLIQGYQLTVYLLLLVALLCYWLLGRKWRERFRSELALRHLKLWERILLCFIGLLELVFSNLINAPLEDIEHMDAHALFLVLLLLGLSSFIMTVTVIIVVIVGNKQTFYRDKVSDMQLNIIVMMAEIVENRDENTGGHIRRTAKYVEIIAKRLKEKGAFKDILTDDYIRDMIVAAPLHDIGKIHVSDAILNKPGRLTEEEFEIMKSHAAAGRDLLKHAKIHLGRFRYLDIAVDMAGAHHEWWDGSAKGYPDRLKGEEIPVCARIMAVADVFDALISKRCYKEPMPLEKAFGIIRQESGTHFDPEITQAFFEEKAEIEKALEVFAGEEEEMHLCGH